MKQTFKATPMIVIEAAGRTMSFASLKETVPFLRSLSGTLVINRKLFCKSRRVLGASLLQVRNQVEHGEWERFRRELSVTLEIHEHTLRNAIVVADRLLTKTGGISRRKLGAISANPHRGGDLTVAEVERMSFRKLEEIAGARSAALDLEPVFAADSADDGAPNFECGNAVDGAECRHGHASAERETSPVKGAGGEQLTLAGLYGEVGELFRRVQSEGLEESIRYQIELATRRYMREVDSICEAARLSAGG